MSRFSFNVPSGLYNIVLFSCNGSEAATKGDSDTIFTINGVTHIAQPSQDTSFVLGNNYVVFTNVVVTAGTLTGTYAPYTKRFGALNGAQVKYVGPVTKAPTSLGVQAAGNQLSVAWPADHAGWTLQTQASSTSTGLSTNWVDVVGSNEGTQVSIPLDSTNGCNFYRLILK